MHRASSAVTCARSRPRLWQLQGDADLWTTALLRFEGGILAKCSCAVRMATDNNAVIYGEKGRIVVTSPWFCSGEIHVHIDDDFEAEVIASQVGSGLYTYEINAFASELSGHPIGAREVGMRMVDTLGNIKALDRWRSEIGLVYETD